MTKGLDRADTIMPLRLWKGKHQVPTWKGSQQDMKRHPGYADCQCCARRRDSRRRWEWARRRHLVHLKDLRCQWVLMGP